jgi:multicomponent Na+:H+ antiporter subunit B
MCVIAILFSKNNVNNVIYLGVFSLVMALIYLVMNAPDVAITEAAIGACITTVFFLWALKVLNYKSSKRKNRIEFSWKTFSGLILFGLVLLAIMYFMLDIPTFGDVNAPIHNDVYHFYLVKTQECFNFPNVVTAILAGFRGYDTLGETTVIFTAGVAISLLLKREKS